MHKNIIDGIDVAGEPAPNINPSAPADIVGEYARADGAQVDDAIAAARRAQPSWAATALVERSAILDRIGTTVLARADELADLLAREEGKTINESRGEVRRAGTTFRYFAAQLFEPLGAIYQSAVPDMRVHTTRRPVGVVAVVTPWNFPIAIPAWKIAPALAYGNSVVFKPADLVPGSGWMLTQIARECGLPPGVLNLVMGRGSVVGQRLVESPDVDAITFTGSTGVGKNLAVDAARHGLKRVQLEMGGKNPLVILRDADIEVAVASALDGAFGSTGQRCTASSRLIVHDAVHDEFVERLTARMATLVVGDARDEATTMGPAVSATQRDQDLDYIAIGTAEGATLAAGGHALELPGGGYFVAPTLLIDSTPDMRINQEEIFGPIASVIRVGSEDEALTVANGVEFGLSGGVITRSLASAARFQRELQAGIIAVNRSTASTDHHVPFGGTKGSSHGSREQGNAAKDFFTTTSTVYTAGSMW
ncbi:aldehyde dehydrogenase family protein [Microbacterium sp. Mu-80]|uniref:Aldehyde dehydrogenase family protein n=1 Tax=Microbacterium bandirmense TaxID=3122050 RepID=A0ABU8LHE6_9MICO